MTAPDKSASQPTSHEVTNPDATSASNTAEIEKLADPPAGEPRDPFDPAALRIESTSDTSIGVERPILVVPVRKPDRQTFFRVHPAPDMRLDCRIIEFQAERETYLVTRRIAAMLPAETKPVRLLTCIPRIGGAVFLWPLKLPSDDGRSSLWLQTAQKAAELAETKWVRMQSNMTLGAYDVLISDQIPEPTWPTMTMREMLGIAFRGGRLIEREDHPVIRQLLGSA